MIRVLRSFLRLCLVTSGIALALAVVAVCGLLLRLAAGPIETPVPQSLLDRIAAETAPGWRVEAGGAQLDFSSDDGLNGLKLRDVTLVGDDGTNVVAAPLLALRFALSASLDPYKALTVREVALDGADVTVTRDFEGGIRFDLGSSEDTGMQDDLLAMITRPDSLDSLPRLRIEDATVTYRDASRDKEWRTENARLILDPSAVGLSGTLSLALKDSPGHAILDAFRASSSGKTEAILRVVEVSPAVLAELHPVLAPLARIDAPLSGKIAAKSGKNGQDGEIAVELTAGQGVLHLRDEAVTRLDSFAARMACKTGYRSCSIDAFSIQTPEFGGTATGAVREVGPGRYATELSLADPVLHLSGTEEKVTAKTATLTAHYDTATGIAEIEQAILEALTIPATGDIPAFSAGHLELAATIDPDAQTADLSSVDVKTLRVSTEESGSAAVGALTAVARIDLAANRAEISKARAVGVAWTDPDGGLQKAAILSGAGAYDFARHTLDLSPIAASGLALTTPNGPATMDALFLRGGADLNAGHIDLAEVKIERADLADPSLPEPLRITAAQGSGRIDLAGRTLSDAKLVIESGVLPLPDFYDAPLLVSGADTAFSAFFGETATRITLDKALAQVGDVPASASGTFLLGRDGGASGAIVAALGPVDFRHVPAHWPKGVAPGGYAWVSKNVKRGMVDLLTIKAAFDTADPSKDTLRLAFDFHDATVVYAPALPPIEAARGKGIATLDRFDLKLDRGRVAVPKAGQIALANSDFAIADFAPDIPDGAVKLHATGGIETVLHLLDHDPLGVISPTGFDISAASGDAELQVLMTLPLDADLLIEDVAFDGRAKVRDYKLTEPKTGLPVSGDLMLIKADPSGMTLESDAQIEDIAVRIGYRQDFDLPAPGEPDSELSLESFLSLKDFARHGVDLSAHLSGLTALKARIELFESGEARFTADADLTNAALKADRIGWAKEPGVPATVKLSGQRGVDGGGRVETLTLRGDGMSADGSLTFDTEGEISEAAFSRIALGQSNEIGLRYAARDDGGAGIHIEGPRLDLRRTFARAIEGEGNPQGAPRSGPLTDISLRLARVHLRDDLVIADLRGGVRLRNDTLFAANVEGDLNGDAPTKLVAQRQADGMALRLNTADAGAFARATDLFDGAHRGRLMLDARTVDTVTPSRIRGVVRFDDVVMRDSPTMRRILSGGAIASLLRELTSNGITFEKIELPFSGIGPRWRIEDGVAFGPSLGLTLSGSYDLSARKLDLDGSVSPAYAINGALGNVPVLGPMLTGGEGEGVFGVNFSVEGDADHPSVRVNPLSALAPGFLRKIVAKVGKGGAAPDRGDAPRFKSGGDN